MFLAWFHVFYLKNDTKQNAFWFNEHVQAVSVASEFCGQLGLSHLNVQPQKKYILNGKLDIFHLLLYIVLNDF